MFEHFTFDPDTIAWQRIAISALVMLGAVIAAWLIYRVVFALVRRLAHHSHSPADDIVLDRVKRPVKWALVAIAITIAAQADPFLARYWEPVARFVRPALLGWIVYSLIKAFTAAMELRLDLADDPVAVRSRRTRIAILSRTATFVIIFITVGLILLGIPGVRDIGTTLLASAGIAALAVGAAAQPALKTMIAGLQIAITEPLRIGDLVNIAGHVGRVEEIHMAFIIVRTWDERAIVVPTSEVLETTFENWSRTNEMLTGPVYLHLDPATDVAPVRAEFERYMDSQDLWDKRTALMLMTEAYPESIELRLAVSAKTIGDLWMLRCVLREHMIDWLRREMPGALIRHRLEVEAANARVTQG
ncbi:mechanosensitive ion channel family protein [Aurantiacibacter spongiae]|uniref:Mechanosensitive ion channel protein MscS n=1 Tax=Aurantiacibacter spongiae TaxID=2488860 RepID=A0A3N5DKD9_9SPHN|nr:mechanosensitive ion channel domain-containing protein [Aurantiacibacter spongiae]RPF71235.1 mechanosensitive ion channel protein MscS [Aurantiacibacter spongiae]